MVSSLRHSGELADDPLTQSMVIRLLMDPVQINNSNRSWNLLSLHGNILHQQIYTRLS